ncbi:MAG: bifunctional oligoribonuclease/PAP phosphatase NrnA [Desulfobacterales bacterium]|nr:bifunctional oligoribonuclease/PAP phosphatase NrnA [Desulfobacterales bacterium]
MKSLISHLMNSRTVFLATHVNPDGDALGAVLAMGLALQSSGRKIDMYNESPIPAVYRFLPGIEQIKRQAPSPFEYETVVVLDCGDLDRVGAVAARIQDSPRVINIDHHVTNTGFGHYQLVDPEASSSTEIVYRILKQMRIAIDTAMATSIYTGILTDTGSFRFANTNSRAFDICAEMVGCGVDPYVVAQHVYGTYSLGRIKLLNMALDSIEISPNGKLSLMTLTRAMFAETDTQPEDVDGMINYAKRIEDVRVAALIMENANGRDTGTNGHKRYHVSLRSDGSVDVARIAASFGGGGHFTAAGFGADGALNELKGLIYAIASKL